MPDTPESVLPPYAGQQVAATTISIRNAGDGLSKGMAIAPEVFTLGSRRYVVLEVDVDAHDYKRLKDTNMLVLDQVLKAGVATMVDADLVRSVVDEQRERIQKAADEAKGLRNLYTDDDGLLGMAHARSEHADGLVEGCPVCKHEADQVAKEAEAPPEPTPIKGRRQRRVPSA